MSWLGWSVVGALAIMLSASAAFAQETPPSYSKDIAPFLKKYCTECHGGKVVKSGFDLTSYENLMRGGKKGKKAIIPGNPDGSLIVRNMEGKGKLMPPKNKTQPTKSEIAVVRAWITAGAKDDAKTDTPKTDTPKTDPPKTGLNLLPLAPRFAVQPVLFVPRSTSWIVTEDRPAALVSFLTAR